MRMTPESQDKKPQNGTDTLRSVSVFIAALLFLTYASMWLDSRAQEQREALAAAQAAKNAAETRPLPRNGASQASADSGAGSPAGAGPYSRNFRERSERSSRDRYN